jgi:hypothetical protein
MLQTAATEGKILSVVGNLDITQDRFASQVAQLAANKKWVGISASKGEQRTSRKAHHHGHQTKRSHVSPSPASI